MGKRTQGATSQAGDAGSNPAADEATAIVAAMTEQMPTGDEPNEKPAAPRKVKGLEKTDEQMREELRNPRNDAMEAIARRRAEDFIETEGQKIDLGEADPDVDPADAEAARMRSDLEKGGTPGDEARTDEPSQTARQLEGDLIDDPAKFKVKLKVDGKEVVVPLDEIVRTAQKDQSADRRLAEATRLLAEARAQTAPPAPATPAPAAAPAAPALDQTKIQEFVAATYSGDEERLAKATADLLGGALTTAPAAPATPVITAEVLQRVVQQELRDREVASALTKFRNDNPEIVKDPHLALIADQFLAAETQGVPLKELPDIESVNAALNAAAKRTQDWAKGLGLTIAPKTESTTRRDRVERKQDIDNLPSISASATSTEPRPQTVQDTLAEMRKARGLPV